MVMVTSHNSAYRTRLHEWEGTFSGCWLARLHLPGCDHSVIERVDASDPKGSLNSLLFEGANECLSEHLGKVSFPNFSAVQLLEFLNLLLPNSLHYSKAHDIEAL